MANLEAYGEKVVGLTGSVVEWTQIQNTGTKIAEVDIDGTTTDVYAPSGGGSSLNYSTTEQVVGTWIDGKPLYQKTIDTGTLPNNTAKNVPHGIADLENVVYFSGWCKDTSGQMFPLPVVNGYVSNSKNYSVGVRATATDVVLFDVTNQTACIESYVTIQYTKTTD